MGVVSYADRGAVFPFYAKHHVVIICLLRTLVNFMVIGTATLIRVVFYPFSDITVKFHHPFARLTPELRLLYTSRGVSRPSDLAHPVLKTVDTFTLISN